MEYAGLCKSCVNGLRCGTWSETKCKAFNIRIYSVIQHCESYKKRPKNFKEPKCQCDDCLKNEALYEGEE